MPSQASNIEAARQKLERRRTALAASWELSRLEGEQLLLQRPVELEELTSEQVLAQTLELLGERDMVRLREVLAALERMENGRYGLCERCQRSISLRRLEAIPEARLCVSCAESQEGSRHAHMSP